MNKLNENIAILEAKVKADEAKKIAEEKKEMQEKNDLKRKIRDLKPRIEDLIQLGKKCQELKISFPIRNEMLQFGYDSRFEADGINHDLGFISKDSQIRYLGIKNGGFNGPWDLYTDGTEIVSVSNREYDKESAEPQNCDMKKFLKQFNSFESAFYQWIKSLDNKHDPEDLPKNTNKQATNGRFAEWLNNLGYLEDDDLKMDGAEINADLEKIKDIAPKLYNMLITLSNIE